jgi:hypothetical protein
MMRQFRKIILLFLGVAAFLDGANALAHKPTSVKTAQTGQQFVLEPPLSDLEAEPPSSDCAANLDSRVKLVLLPEIPIAGQPVRVIALSRDEALLMEVRLEDRNGGVLEAASRASWGYTPHAVAHYYSQLEPGEYRVNAREPSEGTTLGCLDFSVAKSDAEVAHQLTQAEPFVWSVRREWDAVMEDLYSVFVAKLFYVRPGKRGGWKPLHQAFRNPERNILHNILGLAEDDLESETPVILKPDCADAPYHVRAYFSWKMGLPFLYNRCRRGNPRTGSLCVETRSNFNNKLSDIADPVARFNEFVKTRLSWEVHAGNSRSLPEKEATDFYPIPLEMSALRPGIIYVDAGGHVLLVTQVEPQTESTIGALYGVDAHPDRTVSHKRFSKGSFIFNPRVTTDGFKAFRPIELRESAYVYAGNSEITLAKGRVPHSDAQAHFDSADNFYDAVFTELNPKPVDPQKVLQAKIEVLYQAMLERTEAVQIGVDYMKEKDWSPVSMPKGAAIFQTSGPWETYSTPARDMRCFIALDDVLDFPKQAVKQSELYAVETQKDKDALLGELQQQRDKLLQEMTFQYKRSDGSDWTLSLLDVVSRQTDLEMAYNPNDCPETRCAAPEGSEEAATCRRRAPLEQVERMRLTRHWFAKRSRPN